MVKRCASAVVAALLLAPGIARADSPVPQAGAQCPADHADAMTQLPNGSDFLVCRAGPDDSHSWAPVATPFDPNDTWISYGPAITLHGQGFRNPNLTSGQWTATPLDPASSCSAEQVTVVSAGVLAPPQRSQGEPGAALSVDMLPKLFTVSLAGDCLWAKDSGLSFGW
ncbi:hypothetical protein OG976_24050 [Mycobacterium sp. NBC_00419]|uniref:hypothetical protein n=1 Tax=Mycobacterium sp. NBC_00419 TaxID=2975989 RepID=UPI002E1AE856